MLFSIIIPTYNRANVILSTLETFLNQEFKDFEVIIIDDGSKDHTKDVILDFIKLHHLTNFQYFYIENSERGAARNYGIRVSNGQWVTFLDSDDLIYSNHFLVAKEFIFANRDAELFHSAFEVKDLLTGKIKKVNYPHVSSLNQVLLKGNLIGCYGVFAKREVFENVIFSENRELSGSEDWLLWLRLSVRYTFLFNSNVTGCMVQHNDRSVSKLDSNKFKIRINILIYYLQLDEVFIQKVGSSILKKIKAHMYTYGALHLSLIGDKKISLQFLIIGLKLNFLEIFSRRFLVNVKNLFFS